LEFSDVDVAYLIVDPRIKSRDLYLRLGRRRGTKLDIQLTKGRVALQSSNSRVILAGLLHASAVSDGSFAHSGLTKREAIALVTMPPLPGEPLPEYWHITSPLCRAFRVKPNHGGQPSGRLE
jgi:hypothetical protein